jgi:hypothetical protein
MELPKVGSQSFQASSVELALLAGKAFMHVELWVWFGSVRTDGDAGWVCEFARVLTQISRESLPKLLGNAMLLLKVGCDLRIRSGKSVLALATDEGSTFDIYVEIAARQQTRH